MANRLHDLTGQKFNSLEVICRADKRKGVYWHCLCECGNTKTVRSSELKSGVTKSCGCVRSAYIRARQTKHGGEGSPLYRTWSQMKQRCYAPANDSYKYYGAKGIEVCAAWRDDFSAFREWALRSGYKQGLTIERRKNDLGYSPDNCTWATVVEQNRNQTHNKLSVHAVGLLKRYFRVTSMSNIELGKLFGAHRRTIADVRNGVTWSDVPEVAYVK